MPSRALGGKEKCSDLLQMITAARGAINGLMAEVLEEHVREYLLPRDRALIRRSAAMRFEEYRKHDAISLARLVAMRQVSAKEELETAIARAEQVNPAINAIVHKQYAQARKAVAGGAP